MFCFIYRSKRREKDENTSLKSHPDASENSSKSPSINSFTNGRYNKPRYYFDYQQRPTFQPENHSRIFVIRQSQEKPSLARKLAKGRPSTAPPHRGRHTATQEENDNAFREWLQNKSQGAKDDIMIRKVSRMIEEASGRTMVQEANDKYQGATQKKGISFEEWQKMKTRQKRTEEGKTKTKTASHDTGTCRPKTKNEFLRRSSVSEWYEEKVREEKRQKNKTKTTERMKEAETTFNKWSLRKEWYQLGRLSSTMEKKNGVI